MSNSRRSLRLAFAGILAAAAMGSPAPAYAGPAEQVERCEARLERIEARFREIEERRGYDAAVEWWDKRWAAYYANCLAP